ncbi:MAG: magnesium-translocating P-type ATPase [Bryobacteraceae bacterium]
MTAGPQPIQFETPSPTGLSSGEAERRLYQYGPNEPATRKSRSGLVAFLSLFLNPLSALLLIAATFSVFLGQVVDACIIFLVVALGTGLNFLQTYRSERAVELLRHQVRTTVSVLRDDKWQEVPRHTIVPGDVVRVFPGDLVPADSVLVASKDLFVQQSSLTGESLPVEKIVDSTKGSSDDPNASHMVFLGTAVVSGTGTAIVSATGSGTVFGAIASRLAERHPETEFETSLRRFGLLIMRVVFFLVVFLITVSIALHRDPFESLLFAIALAVGLTPEFLPMITSVTLAREAVEMAKSKVIIKRLPAIQNLGSIDVLCSDKTGTLTIGVMKLSRSIDCFGRDSDHVLFLARVNSEFEMGIHNPLKEAILATPCDENAAYTKCGEIPFDFERRLISIVVEDERGQRMMITKGAPESVLERCTSFWTEAGHQPFSAEARLASRAIFTSLSSEGFRTLAVAFNDVGRREDYSRHDEANLVLAGYVAFEDPVRWDVSQTVSALKEDGVQLKILTGDNELVTKHICNQVGLDTSDVVLGEDLAKMTDSALDHVVEQTSVFARVSPAQKNRIILALRRRSHVVGYLGDGVNDAPSLHTADVGISVDTATDVAREAADIILVEPGLDVLHAGIVQGRRASGNVLKYLLMSTSSNFGNMLSMAGASLFLPFLPMLPTQILLNNFLYDLSQVTIPTDTVDPIYLQSPQRWNMSLIQKFMVVIGPVSSVFDFITFFVLLHYFRASERQFHTGWFVESLATQTLVLLIIRTSGSAIKSRPSWPLLFSILAVVFIALLIPITPVAAALGFTPLPLRFFGFLLACTAAYLGSVEFAKRRIFR